MGYPEFPHLTVLSLQADAWMALVPRHHWVGENYICLLALDDGRMVWARFVTIDRPNSRAIVRPADPAHLSCLRPGDSCAFLDGYYGARVELVLDATRRWFQVRYVPAGPAADGVPRVGTWSAAQPGTESARQLAESASDHEHCSICSSKIGYGGEELGYGSQQGDWICLACHREWVLPRAIGFALDWIGGARDPSPEA